MGRRVFTFYARVKRSQGVIPGRDWTQCHVALIAATDFKSLVSTNSTTRARGDLFRTLPAACVKRAISAYGIHRIKGARQHAILRRHRRYSIH